jgi:hypothetical protein
MTSISDSAPKVRRAVADADVRHRRVAMQTSRTLVALTVLLCPLLSLAAAPKCDGPNNWAANMALTHLRNAGMTTNADLDFSKTRVNRIASEQIDKDLHRQVHRIVFTTRKGEPIEVITVSDASNEECSMSGVEVFVVKSRLPGV